MVKFAGFIQRVKGMMLYEVFSLSKKAHSPVTENGLNLKWY
jgi:hypothetical protein